MENIVNIRITHFPEQIMEKLRRVLNIEKPQ